DKEKGLSLIRIDELSKHNDARPAERVLPGRMLLFQGAFPLRKQLENMKSALHTATLGDAFRELRFVGVEFERREIGPDGKPITEWSASSSDGVRFEEALRTVGRLSAINVQSAEEDEEMAPLIVRGLGLVYRLPLQFEGRKYPSPNIKELNDTVKAIKEKGVSVEVAQDSTEVTPDDLLADGPGGGQQGATSAAEGTKPIGGGGKSPGGGIKPPGAGADKAKEGGAASKGGKGGLGGPEDRPTTGTLNANWEPPEYCLIRFFDISV